MLLIIDKLYLKNGVIMYDSDDAVIKSKYDFSEQRLNIKMEKCLLMLGSKKMDMVTLKWLNINMPNS